MHKLLEIFANVKIFPGMKTPISVFILDKIGKI